MKVKSAWAVALIVGSFNAHLALADGASDEVDSLTAFDSNASALSSDDSVDDFGRGGGGGFHPAPRPQPAPRPFPGPNRGPVRPVGSFHGGGYPWAHWNHPVFVRPAFVWNWLALTEVTCTAVDSYGNPYPVTEDGYAGVAYEAQLANIEDAAIDECYDDTNGDTGCQLQGCTPLY